MVLLNRELERETYTMHIGILHALWALFQTPINPQSEGILSSIVIIISVTAIALSKGYLNKQFSGVHERINGVEKEVSGLRVEIAAMDGRVKSIPADTAVQIAVAYEKGRVASRDVFATKESCDPRHKDVDRRLDTIEKSAGAAARKSEQAGYRLDNLEHGHGGD